MGKAMKIVIMNEKIAGAMARAYCSEGNIKKSLDADLIFAMVREVEKVFEEEKRRSFEEGYNSKMSKYHKEYYRKNKEKMNQRSREYYQKNKALLKLKKWQKANKLSGK